MQEKKNSFVMYTDYMYHVNLLSMEQRGYLFTAIMCYAAEKELPEMDGMTQMAFSFIKSQMDRDMEKYERTVSKRREAGKLGGRPPAKANGFSEKAKKANGFSEKQMKAKKPDTENVNDNDTENDNKKTMCKADASALFEKVWKIYPLKRGKGQVSDADKRHLLDIGYDELERAITRYKADLAKETWKKPQNGSTFFHSGYVDYLDANYEPVDNQPVPSKKNSFTSYPQRNYDYDALEEQLLNAEKRR